MGRARSDLNRAFYVAVGHKISEARNRLGITQEALSSKISLTRTSVINIEKGRQQLLLHTLVHIASALNVTPSELIPESQRLEMKDVEAMLREEGVPKNVREWITKKPEASKHGDKT